MKFRIKKELRNMENYIEQSKLELDKGCKIYKDNSFLANFVFVAL